MNRQRVAPAILIFLLICFGVSSAQRPGGTQEGPAGTLKSTTRLVIVDVVATNSKGEPITDLRAQDFKVLENGKEQDLRVFEFQHPESQRPASMPAGASQPSRLPANVVTNAPKYKPGSSMNVVLLDLLNTANPRQNYARDEFLNFLKKLPAGGPVAIYVLTSDLRLVQDFTDDEAALRATVESLKGKGSALLDNPAAGPAMVVPTAGMPANIKMAVEAKEKEAREFSTGTQMELTLSALSSVARRLAPYSGRKNLIWVSDAFPFYINPRSAGPSDARGGYRLAASKADTVLMDSQVAIYPVDAHAVQTASMFDIGYGKIYGSEANPAGMNASGRDDFDERQAVHLVMNELAEETGGEAFYNSNSIEASLRNGMKDGSTYYTLGYYPHDKNWDGKFRRLSVKADRPGIKLRYRLGYYALEPSGAGQREKDGGRRAGLREAMDLNSPVSSALLFQAMVIGPSEKTGNKVVVNFGIDPRALSFEKDADGLQHATLECAVEAWSEQGRLIGSEGTNINAALPPESFARISKSYFPCQRDLDLPAGSYRLRLGVVDNRTGLIGTANAAATVPAGGAAEKP